MSVRSRWQSEEDYFALSTQVGSRMYGNGRSSEPAQHFYLPVVKQQRPWGRTGLGCDCSVEQRRSGEAAVGAQRSVWDKWFVV